jgi:UDP-N-acetylglucosamine--N-acetylmuramyl-(pentapeptide) pyrophosphoryl-undecaprenol N-acetylglucosamine transferase
VRAAYDAVGLNDVRVEEFIDDVAGALAEVDVVVARAGATTVAELSCVGRPAVFIPFPHAADDHQTLNARSLVDASAARMIREADLNTESLVEALLDLATEPTLRAEMGRRARERGRPNAAVDIVRDLWALSGHSESMLTAPRRVEADS